MKNSIKPRISVLQVLTNVCCPIFIFKTLLKYEIFEYFSKEHVVNLYFYVLFSEQSKLLER